MPRDPGRGRRRSTARSAATTSPRSASPTSARRSSPGTARPASRTAPRSSGRTAARAAAATSWRRRAHLPLVRERTGLVLDPYFSGTKFEWLLTERDIPVDRRAGARHDRLLADLEPHRRRGARHRRQQRQPHDAVRHPRAGSGSTSCATCSHVPIDGAAGGRARRAAAFGVTSRRFGVPAGIPISGVAGDQQAALFGQACFTPGMAKNTYGTGSFVLLNVGADVPAADRGDAHHGGLDARRTARSPTPSRARSSSPARPSSGCATGCGSSTPPPRSGRWPRRSTTPAACIVVPAFTGLGSPWWDPYARGTIVGITRGTTRAHLARAVVESMAYQTRDAVDAMVGRQRHARSPMLRVDGGASVMDLLLQMQADQLGVTVRAPDRSGDDGARCGLPRRPGRRGVAVARRDRRPLAARRHVRARRRIARSPTCGHAEWLRAVERSRGWART